MATIPTEGFLGLAEAFTILAKYNDESYVTDAEHDILYAQVDADKVTDEDMKKLDELGWHVDSEYGCMAMFT